ncbi:hypothetical protein LOAG_03905 [Loa loa]|uniref:Uncharacterized protein n=1 Tax=Loa loa TaxID=7209 RepID=A0A1S0U440_LOALO|nr:hypothetical protein LOAG_03905 [Loa loa]EFO24583.1 hypothetical protein LOAG_03905 [Loa loa]
MTSHRNESKEIEEEKAGESGGSSSGTISEGDDLGEIVVPSTPKSKMKKKLDEKVSKDDENVMQTPLSKLNRIPTRKNEKLAVLLEQSLKTQSQQQSRKRKSLPMTRGRVPPRKSRNSLPSSPSASSVVNVPRTRSARVNLNERFAMMDRLNEETNASAATTSPAAVSKDISLDKSIIERYRKRIEAVRHSARKSDKNEVFYGRSTSRRNLFDDSIDEEDSEGVATRSTTCIQKNRSGRSVQTSQKVYMAHALLNVYNTDPLNPPKLPKDAPFKLHRLIRPASKSDKKRLFKLRLRIAREKSSSSSSLIRSGTSCGVLEAASSSKETKTKSETVEENSSSGSEKFGAVNKKEILESGNPEETMDVSRGSCVRKLSRRLSGTPKYAETDSRSSSQSSRKHSSKKGSKSSCSFNGVSSNKSKISDSNGSVSEKSSKISTEAMDDVSQTVVNSCISSDSVSEKSESADIIGDQMRKASYKVTMDKIENEDETVEILSGIPCKMKGKQDEMNVS